MKSVRGRIPISIMNMRKQIGQLSSILYPLIVGIIVGLAGGAAISQADAPKLGLWEDVALKSPNKSRPHLNLSAAYIRQGRYAKGLDEAELVIKLSPDSVSGYINAASAAMKLGAWELAFKYTSDALQRKGIKMIAHNYVILAEILGKKNEADLMRGRIKTGEFRDYTKLDLNE